MLKDKQKGSLQLINKQSKAMVLGQDNLALSQSFYLFSVWMVGKGILQLVYLPQEASVKAHLILQTRSMYRFRESRPAESSLKSVQIMLCYQAALNMGRTIWTLEENEELAAIFFFFENFFFTLLFCAHGICSFEVCPGICPKKYVLKEWRKGMWLVCGH